MNKKLSHLLAFFLCGILLTVLFTGCINEGQKPAASTETLLPEVPLDHPSVLPNWTDGDYHDYFATTEMLNGLNDKYPDLVNVFSIGKSVLGKDIWCIRLTNEKNNTIKSSCLIDGCIHGGNGKEERLVYILLIILSLTLVITLQLLIFSIHLKFISFHW